MKVQTNEVMMTVQLIEVQMFVRLSEDMTTVEPIKVKMMVHTTKAKITVRAIEVKITVQPGEMDESLCIYKIYIKNKSSTYCM
jgi:hypothetical protein